MNQDCWDNIFKYHNVKYILNIQQCNKYFNTISSNSIIWMNIGKILKLDPPKIIARKYTTWKSIILKKPFCELCCKFKSCIKKLERNLSYESSCYACFD